MGAPSPSASARPPRRSPTSVGPARQPASAPQPPSGAHPDGAVGSTGIGDAYYPDSGNGGYQVDNYNIAT